MRAIPVCRIVNKFQLYTLDGKFDGFINDYGSEKYYIYSNSGVIRLWNSDGKDIGDENNMKAFTVLKKYFHRFIIL